MYVDAALTAHAVHSHRMRMLIEGRCCIHVQTYTDAHQRHARNVCACIWKTLFVVLVAAQRCIIEAQDQLFARTLGSLVGSYIRFKYWNNAWLFFPHEKKVCMPVLRDADGKFPQLSHPNVFKYSFFGK